MTQLPAASVVGIEILTFQEEKAEVAGEWQCGDSNSRPSAVPAPTVEEQTRGEHGGSQPVPRVLMETPRAQVWTTSKCPKQVVLEPTVP